MYLPKKRIQMLSLLGLLFLAQCCCIVIPFQGQVQEIPAAAQIIDSVRSLPSDLSGVSSWVNDLRHLVAR